ncbi:protein-disulfide reductase DsbD domain-containing protein [Primorskyibacter flagellatus]|uniref:Thiol-disulfide interchange protein, contains DsbC and DsbD domains n=1 Tax=Primorskyibacter flagellatus TaxID=1387277 RepID=A0A1W2AXQ9_9RHOB|nr:protein-disulfide reductase DsbD domain-containing protein [Primorskyibacter flagellatus]SMC65330.1 Thiol-disulfide interchange protein, contains DsbC and DsbD domains [Primorskyibacter flagellatus]
MITAAVLSFGLLGTALQAASSSSPIRAELLPGWRLASGDHIAALRLVMSPGWKTYWRAPGDAGIPPVFGWQGSQGVSGVQVMWPVPHVFDQQGMQSIGYAKEVILPLRISTTSDDIALNGRVQIGICKDICIPEELRFRADLSAKNARPDPRISAAMANVPLTSAEAGVGRVSCELAPSRDGLTVTARIDMPRAGGTEVAVVETANPYLWVAEAQSERQAGTLVARTEIMHVDGKAFALKRDGIRITVLGSKRAVDIQGCPAP